jgi:hypothetical protein
MLWMQTVCYEGQRHHDISIEVFDSDPARPLTGRFWGVGPRRNAVSIMKTLWYQVAVLQEYQPNIALLWYAC